MFSGDVLHLEHDQVCPAVPVTEQHRHPTDPDRGAVGAHQTQLRGALVDRSGDDSGALLESSFEVVGVNHVTKPAYQEPRLVVPKKIAQPAVDNPEGAVQ